MGGAWSTPKFNEALKRVTREGLLQEDGQIHPDWREALTVQAARRPGVAATIAAVRAAAPQSWFDRSGLHRSWNDPAWHDDTALARTARLMTLAGDVAGIERLIGRVEARFDARESVVAPILLRHAPTDVDFLDGLDPGLRDRVCSAHVERVLEYGIVDAGVAEMIVALRDRDQDWGQWLRLDFALMRLDILGERHEAAKARIARLGAADAVLAEAGEAALAFLAGPPQDALPGFREALKRRRKVVGRRKIALSGDFGLYHLLAMFAAADPGLLGEISTQLEILGDSRSDLAAALYALFLLVSGHDGQAKLLADRFLGPPVRSREGPLPNLVITLALAVVEGANARRREDEDRRAADAWGALAPPAARTLADVH